MTNAPTMMMYPMNLVRGDKIVVKKSSAGVILGTMLVEDVAIHPRGCKGKVHVNKDKCYDNAVMVEVMA